MDAYALWEQLFIHPKFYDYVVNRARKFKYDQLGKRINPLHKLILRNDIFNIFEYCLYWC